MDIHIHPDKKLIEIQHEFHTHFPFLKLEFYKQTHSSGEVTGKAEQIDLQTSVKELKKDDINYEWHINGLMTVNELESNFQEKLNIGVQVFRKSNINWLQTGATDHWTLAEQNAKGREMSEEIPKEEPEDYHEHE